MMITADKGFIEQSTRYAFDNAGKSLQKYILLNQGELAYNHGASKLRPYGSCFSLKTVKEARIPFVYHCFSVGGNDSEFISVVLNGNDVSRQLRQIVSSGARMDGLLNISYEDYSKIKIWIPCYQEQGRVSNVFSLLDTLITLHQCKSFISELFLLIALSYNRFCNIDDWICGVSLWMFSIVSWNLSVVLLIS